MVGWRSRRWLAAATLLLGSISLTACVEESRVTVPDNTFVGTLIARQGSTATFVLESLRASSAASPGAPALVIGERVDIRYYSGAQYLHIGTRYRVATSWRSSQFASPVQTAEDPCHGGTVYANGKAIDASCWKQTWRRRLTSVSILLPLIVVVVGFGGEALVRRRRRRAAATGTNASAAN